MDARARAIQGLLLDRLAATVVSNFDAAGVPSLLLKGLSLKRWLYTDGHPRRYTDVDLLVPPTHLTAAERSLSAMGCRPLGDPAPHARTWTSPPGTPGTVDLHHSFHYVTVADQRCWEVLAADCVTLDVAGQEVRAPSPTALATLLTLHAVRGDASSATQVDLARALRSGDDELWAGAADIAEQLGASEAFAQGLRQAADGQRLVDLLSLPPLSSPTLALTLADRPRTTAGVGRLYSAWGSRDLLRRLGAELIPSPAHMRSCYPRLARWRTVGLYLSYVVRPAFVIVQAPAGIRTWRQLQRGLAKGPAGPSGT